MVTQNPFELRIRGKKINSHAPAKLLRIFV